MTHFPGKNLTQIDNAIDASNCNVQKLHDYHFNMIAKDGIFFLPGKLGAISDAHTRSDIKAMKKATESFVSDLKK